MTPDTPTKMDTHTLRKVHDAWEHCENFGLWLTEQLGGAADTAMTEKQKVRKVWVGYSDGQPHVYLDSSSTNGSKVVAVYPSRAEARRNYEDARAMWLIPVEEPQR